MTRDEQLIRAALEMAADEWPKVRVEGGLATAAVLAYADRIRALDPAEVLAGIPNKDRTKPSIDWSHVSAKFNAMTTDEDGHSWLTKTIPVKGADEWEGAYYYIPAEYFASFTPGTCDWQDSLVVRPGYVEDKE